MKLGSLLPLLLGALACPSLSLAAGEATRPNILFTIADDWGDAHAGAYGCQWIKTPVFDRVADQGILFSHAFIRHNIYENEKRTLQSPRSGTGVSAVQ